MKNKKLIVLFLISLIFSVVIIINGCVKENNGAMIFDGSLKWDMNDGIILENSRIEVVTIQDNEFIGRDKRRRQILFLNSNLLPPGEEGTPERPITITLVNGISIEDVSESNILCNVLNYPLDKKEVLLVDRGHQISQLEATRLCVKISSNEFLELKIKNSLYELNWGYYKIKND